MDLLDVVMIADATINTHGMNYMMVMGLPFPRVDRPDVDGRTKNNIGPHSLSDVPPSGPFENELYQNYFFLIIAGSLQSSDF